MLSLRPRVHRLNATSKAAMTLWSSATRRNRASFAADCGIPLTLRHPRRLSFRNATGTGNTLESSNCTELYWGDFPCRTTLVRQRMSDELQFASLNVRSLSDEVDDFREVRRDRSIDVLCLVETWYDTDGVYFLRHRSDGFQVTDWPRLRQCYFSSGILFSFSFYIFFILIIFISI